MRLTRCLALLLLAALALPCLAQAEETYTLFAAYPFGMPRSAVEKLPGVSKGEGGFAGDLLLPEAYFAGEPWNVRFEFQQDKLVRVSLMEAYSRARMDKVTAALRNDRYEMLALQVDSRRLDVVGLLKAGGTDSVRERMAELLGGSPQQVIYAWFQTTDIPQDMKMVSRDLAELLMAAPASLREAEVTVLAHATTKQPAVLLVDFSFPVLMVQQAR